MLLLAVLLPLAGGARACGYEDPASVSLGALNFAYPDALHVGTAVWQAEQSGLLPRRAMANFNARAPVETAHAAAAATWEAMLLLDRLRTRLALAGPRQPLAVALLPAVLWSRVVPADDALVLATHVDGPRDGDVVLISEPAALAAWVDGRIDADALLRHGLARTYGSPSQVAALADWMASADAARATPRPGASP